MTVSLNKLEINYPWTKGWTNFPKKCRSRLKILGGKMAMWRRFLERY